MLTQKRKKKPYNKNKRRNNNYYNQKEHLKISKTYKSPEREKKHKELLDKMEEGANQQHQFDVFSNINEKYAHDLVILGAIAQMAMNIAEQHRSDAEKRLLEKIKNEELSDKSFKANMENYLDFKTNYKYSKVLEAKLSDNNINDNQKEQLNNELAKTLAKIEANAQKFKFHTENPEEVLTFKNTKEFIDFIDAQEGNTFAKSYRSDILDADELNAIYQADTDKLFDLAIKTTDNMDNVTLNTLDKKSTQTIKGDIDAKEIAQNFSPALNAL